MCESYPERVFLTQSDQSQHLKRNERADQNTSSSVLRTSTVLCSCRSAPAQLPRSAEPASTLVLATQLCQQKLLADVELRCQDGSFPGLPRLPRDAALAESPYRITECLGLEGTSVGHPVQPPAQAGSPRAGCTAPRPGGA